MTNRIAQRVFFVSGYYGLAQGLLSIPRLFWGNFINFMANWRAIRQIVRQGDARRVAWDKTTHEFPVLGEQGRARRPLGGILVAQGAIDAAQLDAALLRRSRGLKLGSWLVHEGVITAHQLAAAVAEQSGVRVGDRGYALSRSQFNRTAAGRNGLALRGASAPRRGQHARARQRGRSGSVSRLPPSPASSSGRSDT